MFKNKKSGGFTLIEILVVIGIIALLATIVLIAINPARQFAQARDTQRVSNLNALLNAVGQRTADNKGLFQTGCSAGAIPTSTSTISSAGYNIRPCLVPTYISELSVDPTTGTPWNGSTYDTGYSIVRDVNGRIHVIATEPEPNIPRTGNIEVVR